MKKRHQKIYNSVVCDIRDNLSDSEILNKLKNSEKDITKKKIINSMVLGFSDPELNEPITLTRLAGLIVRCRLAGLETSAPSASAEGKVPHDTSIAEPASLAPLQEAVLTDGGNEPVGIVTHGATKRKQGRTGSSRKPVADANTASA